MKMGTGGKNDPERNDITVARNLRRYRIAAGMSQVELANALGGLTFQQIQKYENGSNAIAPGPIRKTCKVLGITTPFGASVVDKASRPP